MCQQGVVSVSWVTLKVRVLSCPVEWGCSGGAGKGGHVFENAGPAHCRRTKQGTRPEPLGKKGRCEPEIQGGVLPASKLRVLRWSKFACWKPKTIDASRAAGRLSGAQS